VESEDGIEDQEEEPFAERADGTLRFGPEQDVNEIAGSVQLEAEAEPGEIVAEKPSFEIEPVNCQAEQHGESVEEYGAFH
jgi:hypothetical protein